MNDNSDPNIDADIMRIVNALEKVLVGEPITQGGNAILVSLVRCICLSSETMEEAKLKCIILIPDLQASIEANWDSIKKAQASQLGQMHQAPSTRM